MVLLLASAALAAPTPDAGTLARVGEVLGGATVESVEQHPEYERQWLRLAEGGRVPVELTGATAGAEGQCTHGGVTLYVRDELAEGPGRAPLPTVELLCARLAAHPPTLRPRGGFVPGPPPPTPPVAAAPPPRDPDRPLLLGPLHAVAAAVLALALVALRRVAGADRRDLAGVGLTGAASLALGVLSRPGIFNGAGAAYEKIVLAWGVDVDNPYGAGVAALHGPLLAALGRDPAHLFATNGLWARLAPPLLWLLVRQHADRRAALGAGLGLAGLPLLLRLGPTELLHVPLTTLGLLALVAATAWRRRPAWDVGLLALGATLLVVNLRPEALLFPLVVAAFLWGAPRPWPLLVAVLGVGVLRLATLPLAQDVLRPAAWLRPETILSVVIPHLAPRGHLPAAATFWNAALTPAALWPFALLGLVAAPAPLRARLLVWWLLVEVPVWTKVSPVADAARLQLPAQVIWAGLVGIGAAALPARGWVALPGALGLAWYLARPDWLRWANHAEFAVLAREVPALGADEVVLFEDTGPRVDPFVRVMQTLGPARWVRASEWLGGATSVTPTRWWEGITMDAGVRDAVEARCTFGAARTHRITGATDEDLHLDAAGVEVGFREVRACNNPR